MMKWIKQKLNNKKALKIIAKNLRLADDPKIPIIEMVNKQEKLINQFESLGYSRKQFFNASIIYFKDSSSQ